MLELGKLHHGISYEQYADEPGLRTGDLHKLRRSAAHYLAAKAKPDKPTPAMKFGSLFHSAIENPEKFRDLLRVEPIFEGFTKSGERTTSLNAKDVQKKRADWYADLPKEAIVVEQEDADRIIGMVKSVTEHPRLRDMLKGGVAETSLWVDDPATGTRLKYRIDYLNRDGWVLDFKTTEDAQEHSFTTQIFSDRPRSPLYCLTGASYAYGTKVAGLSRGDHYVFVVVESEAPYSVVPYVMGSGPLDVGERHRAALTRRYANCVKENKWPGYATDFVDVEIPLWVETPRYPETEKSC